MVTLFGTDGVRGLVNSTLMPELAYQLGRAAGAYFCKASGKHRFLIGMDTRISGSMLTVFVHPALMSILQASFRHRALPTSPARKAMMPAS